MKFTNTLFALSVAFASAVATAIVAPEIKANEHTARVAGIREAMNASNYGVYVASGQENIYYITGASITPIERPFFVVVTASRLWAIVPKLDHAQVAASSALPDGLTVVSYFDYPAPQGQAYSDALTSVMNTIVSDSGSSASMGSGVAYEPTTPAAFAEAVCNAAAEAGIQSCAGSSVDVVQSIRAVKTRTEVAFVRNASAYAAAGMKNMMSKLYGPFLLEKGASILELLSGTRDMQVRIIKEDGMNPATTSLLHAAWPAPESADPHSAPPLAKRIGAGPVALMAYYRVNGYAAECERTVLIGSTQTQQVIDAYDAMLAARAAAFAVVKPGTALAAVDEAARNSIAASGFGAYLKHRTGHGIGIGNHEPPFVAVGSSDVLVSGMIISVEPGIYIQGVGGFRHSDTVLVTDTGYEILTGSVKTERAALTFTDYNPGARIVGLATRIAAGIE